MEIRIGLEENVVNDSGNSQLDDEDFSWVSSSQLFSSC